MNVRTLSPRLGILLGWGFDIVAASEVRVASPAMKALARVARANNFDVVFGNPPPPSPTFSVSPGGLAVFARLPRVIRKVHPPELMRWEEMGRVLTVDVIHGDVHILLVNIYGFALSHPSHGTNDDMLAQCFAWAGCQKLPVACLGDFNETLQSSASLVSAHEHNMLRVSPDSTTTAGKTNHKSRNLPIDHVLVNRCLFDSVVASVVRYDLPLADHFPIITTFLTPDLTNMTWQWPKPNHKISDQIVVRDVPFHVSGTTYVEWAEACRRWLQTTYGVTIPPKICRTTTIATHLPPKLPRQVSVILKTIRSALHLQKLDHPHWGQTQSLTRKTTTLNIEWDGDKASLETVLATLTQMLQSEVKTLHEAMMRQWREKVKTWTLATRHIHAYVKNDVPARSLAINVDGVVTNHSQRLAMTLNKFWCNVESWPRNLTDEDVWDQVEDRFAAFLPHVPCVIDLSAAMMKDRARYMKKRTHGCDGWAISEIQKLPTQAWEAFLWAYKNVWPNRPPELLTLKRRTPIEKAKTGVPEVNQVRPIDVFSTLLRLVASCLCILLRTWLLSVTHPTQTATHGGILASVTSLAFWAECTLNATVPVYAFSLDLSMMFNMMSPTISGRLARVAGLGEETVKMLTWPLVGTRAVWRLPSNVLNQTTVAERGLPQGMASSVLLAELNVACLVRKLHCAVECHTIVYVDDINVVTHSLPNLQRCLDVVLDFIAVFRLSLSIMKSALWGTDHHGLKCLESTHGIKPVHVVEAFGATWQLKRGESVVFKKEEERISRVRERLLRVQHLPTHPYIRALVTSSTALSPLDYVSLPGKKMLHSLRSHVRAAIGGRHGAPEIIFNMPTTTLLDPVDRGMLSLLRLWIQAYNVPTYRDMLVSGAFSSPGGRFAGIRKECESRDIHIRDDTISFGSGPGAPEFRLWAGWSALRKQIVGAIKDLQFRGLQARRPGKFAGNIRCAWKTMRKEYARATAYEASILLRIWSGSIMTASHRHTISPEVSSTCRCGMAEETLNHMLWECELHREHRPDQLSWWSTLPPAMSMSLILPLDESRAFVADWRKVCKWAIHCVTTSDSSHDTLETLPNLPPAPNSCPEQNGHLLAVRGDLGYVWCMRCFVTRRVRDTHFLTNRPCPKALELPLPEGHYVHQRGHISRVFLETWKLHSWRPRLQCVKCGQSQWATAPYRKPCPGG